MATFKYYFRLTKEEKEALNKRRKIENPIRMLYARLRDSNLDIPVRLGIKLDVRRWNDEKGQLNLSADNALDYDEINNKLRNFKVKFENELNKAQLNGIDINQDWVKKQVSDFFNKSTIKSGIDINIYFIDYIKHFIELSKTKRVNSRGNSIGKRTIQDYEKTLHRLERYEELSRKRLKHLDINLEFHGNFIDFCRDYEVLAENTIGGEIKNLKTFLHGAELDGIKVNTDFKKRDFYHPSDETHDIALSEKEIEIIANHDFSSSPRLDNVRDWLVIGIWTGLRVGDLLSLTPQNIEKRSNDNYYILVKPRKSRNTTNIEVVIPIHKNVQAILDKRKGQFPSKISDQKFNDYIKEVAERVGLTDLVEGACMVEKEAKNIDGTIKKVFRKQFGIYPKYMLLTSHSCRRSFATNHYGKIHNFMIMAITGHKTERVFLKYIKKTPNESADSFLDYWNNKNV